MKGILEFDLNDKDDIEAHLRCTKALDMAMALSEIKEYIRSKAKYSEEDTIKIEKVKDDIQDIIWNRDIDLDHLIS